MEKYLGVKLIEAEPMNRQKFCKYYGAIEGDFDEKIEDGYKIITYPNNCYKARYKTLSQELIRELFEYKNNMLYWRNKPIGFRGDINKPAGYDSGNGYLKVGIFGDRYYLHRLIMKYHYGDIVDSYEIDHINHDTLDNSLDNLRLVTSQENSFNLRSKGISFVKSRNKWVSYLDIDGKRISLGRYTTEEEALAVRKAKQDELFNITSKFEIEWSPKDVFEKAYRSINSLTFGLAVEALRQGKLLARKGWNGKDMFVFKQVPAEINQNIIHKMQSIPGAMKKRMLDRSQRLNYRNQMCIVDAMANIDSWVPSSSDIFAEDWFVLE